MHITNVAAKALIKALYDTGGTLNTGSLKYHKFIRSKIPDTVSRFEELNGTNPFDPIKLSGTLRDPDEYDRNVAFC